MKKENFYQKGQTVVILLVYMIVAIIVTTAAVALVINSSLATDKAYQGANALDIAESGAQNAIINLIRDRDYTGQSRSDFMGGKLTISVTGAVIKTITSTGELNNFSRSVQATADTSNYKVVVTSWKEL